MNDKEILDTDTSVLVVRNFESGNIINCVCVVESSTFWNNPGGLRGEMITDCKIGDRYKSKMNMVPMGHGVRWNIVSIEKLDPCAS